MTAGYGISVEGLRLGRIPTATALGSLCLSWRSERAVAPADAPPVWVREEADTLTVGWAGLAEYRVGRAPSEARVSLIGADEEQAALCFLLSMLPLAVPLFGLEPMHGSAVALDTGALLLLGASGSGKSTLASRLAGMGWRFLADDASAIDASGRLWPGPPLLARRAKGEPWPVVGPHGAKTVVRLPGHRPDPIRPSAVAVLAPQPGGSHEVRSVDSSAAIKALLGHVRAPGVLAARRRPLQLRVAATLARLPVCEVSYDHGRHSVDKVAQSLIAWASDASSQRKPAAMREVVA